MATGWLDTSFRVGRDVTGIIMALILIGLLQRVYFALEYSHPPPSGWISFFANWHQEQRDAREVMMQQLTQTIQKECSHERDCK